MTKESSSSERWDELPRDKGSVLEARSKRAIAGLAGSGSMGRRPAAEAAPLSLAQERLWFLDRLEPGTVTNNRPWGLHLTGPLDLPALEGSLSEIVRRHEILRATIREVDGIPQQTIRPSQPLVLPLIDLSALPERDRLEQARHRACEEAWLPFDLSTGPLVRPMIFRLGEAEHVLLLTIHHIVFDRWSAGVFQRELEALYEAKVHGRPSPLAELPIQYADFAHWQRSVLQGEILEEHLAYWKNQLGGDLPTLRLPSDRSPSAASTRRGATHRALIPDDLCKALAVLSRREDVTLFMTLLAGFSVLLSRISGEDDILLGSPTAGRTRLETEDLIGLFLNTLVLRVDLSGSPTFGELLRRVRQVALGAYAHQDLPFGKLVETLNPERDLRRSPLFQVFFNLENMPEGPSPRQGLAMKDFEFDSGISQFDLTMELARKHEGLSCSLHYCTELFDESTIRRMGTHFLTLLEGIAADPDRPVSQLPLLSHAERHQLLVEWNNTRLEPSRGACAHQLIEAQADRTPQVIAVEFEGSRLTYRELDARANQVARRLIELGVRPDTLVGICCEPSLDMVVGLLGILKAGGAYLPLDPSHPSERISYSLSEAKSPVAVTDTGSLSRLPTSRAVPLCLDDPATGLATESQERPTTLVTPDHLAYAIYTSGSTGRPKSVLVSHSSLVNLLEAARRRPGLTHADILLSVTTLTFDIATLELLLPLTVGARVVLIRREVASDGSLLAAEIARRGATMIQATPATWQLLVDAGWPGDHRLRILSAGEALPRSMADWLLERCGSLWNLYGPTETTIWSTAYEVRPGGESVPIGRPIANTQTYIVDGRLQPVPIGVAGELLIGGAGLARGYLNNPGMTAERFVSNPFSDESGSRAYKTGDLARYRPDGNIEFLGRMDNQVKIRGFRVELEEVEAVLRQHPVVRQAVVAVDDSEAGRRLIAYVVLGQGQEPSIPALRGFLQKSLPGYMVPSAFVTLERIPLAPNGKVDRRALARYRPVPLGLEHAFVAPRTPVEKTLADIWAQLLGLDRVGVLDDFFALGGHSLLATRVVSRIREAFGVEVSLRRFFDSAPTIATLANSIEELRGRPSVGAVPGSSPEGEREEGEL